MAKVLALVNLRNPFSEPRHHKCYLTFDNKVHLENILALLEYSVSFLENHGTDKVANPS
jgi:hypothetical protein